MQREPAFNVPSVILGLIAVLAVVHVVRTELMTPFQDGYFLGLFAFDPVRYESTVLPFAGLPGGVGAQVWTFFTYALVHGSWLHFAVNAIWLLPFGSAVARRFGPWRFMAFFVVTAAAGALAHLVSYPGLNAPMVGASAAISGTMAGAIRFAFQPGGPLHFTRTGEDVDYRVPAIPLTGVFRDPRVLIFLGVWFGINLLFGATSLSIGHGDEVVAWQAHIGGFVAGLLLFSWFDRPPDSRQFGGSEATGR